MLSKTLVLVVVVALLALALAHPVAATAAAATDDEPETEEELTSFERYAIYSEEFLTSPLIATDDDGAMLEMYKKMDSDFLLFAKQFTAYGATCHAQGKRFYRGRLYHKRIQDMQKYTGAAFRDAYFPVFKDGVADSEVAHAKLNRQLDAMEYFGNKFYSNKRVIARKGHAACVRRFKSIMDLNAKQLESTASFLAETMKTTNKTSYNANDYWTMRFNEIYRLLARHFYYRVDEIMPRNLSNSGWPSQIGI